jgi:hypothetical protein
MSGNLLLLAWAIFIFTFSQQAKNDQNAVEIPPPVRGSWQSDIVNRPLMSQECKTVIRVQGILTLESDNRSLIYDLDENPTDADKPCDQRKRRIHCKLDLTITGAGRGSLQFTGHPTGAANPGEPWQCGSINQVTGYVISNGKDKVDLGLERDIWDRLTLNRH